MVSQQADVVSRHRVVVGLLFALGIFFRFYAVDRIPLPVYADELSNMYDAYSLVETGADRVGARAPIVVRAFGDNDYRPAMMVWLTTIPVKLFGFSVASGRLVPATLSVLSLILIFLLAGRIAGPTFATLTLLFATLSPWLILDGRVAHEGAALAPLFVILILYVWHRAAEVEYRISMTMLLGFVAGFSANAYQTTRLIGPLLLALVLIDILRTKKRIDAAPFALALSALVGAAPQIWVMFSSPERFFARAAETVAKGDGPAGTIAAIVSGFAANFGPRYLFWPDMTEAFLTTARLLPVGVIFFPLGLATMAGARGWKIPRFRLYFYIALVIAAMPAALTNQNPHSLRAAACAVIIPFFTAAGVQWLLERFNQTPARAAAARRMVGFSIAASFCFVAFMYLAGRAVRGLRMQNAIVQSSTKVRPLLPRYERVVITNDGLHPYLYYVAFTGMTPKEYQAAPKEIYSERGWDVVRRVGKFYFRSDKELVSEARSSRAAGRADLFVSVTPLPGSRMIDSVSWHWDKYYISDFRPAPRAIATQR